MNGTQGFIIMYMQNWCMHMYVRRMHRLANAYQAPVYTAVLHLDWYAQVYVTYVLHVRTNMNGKLALYWIHYHIMYRLPSLAPYKSIYVTERG